MPNPDLEPAPPEIDGPREPSPWLAALKFVATAMKVAGGVSFAVVAIMWGAVMMKWIGDFNYLPWGFVTAAVYFAGRLLGYILKFFDRSVFD